jgi:hypothetical protein
MGLYPKKTRKVYLAESFNFMKWLVTNEPTSLTQHGLDTMNGYMEVVAATERHLYSRCRDKFDQIMRCCEFSPVISIENLTPEIYMNYCRQLRNKRTRQYLGQSTIGVKRAALFHLYWLHNGAAYSYAFNSMY